MIKHGLHGSKYKRHDKATVIRLIWTMSLQPQSNQQCLWYSMSHVEGCTNDAAPPLAQSVQFWNRNGEIHHSCVIRGICSSPVLLSDEWLTEQIDKNCSKVPLGNGIRPRCPRWQARVPDGWAILQMFPQQWSFWTSYKRSSIYWV